MSFYWGHWYPCFGFLVMSPLGFKARVGSALFAIFAEVNVMYIPQDSPLVLHLLTSWRPVRSQSLPHMHVQRWDLARFRMCNRTNALPLCQRPGSLFVLLFSFLLLALASSSMMGSWSACSPSRGSMGTWTSLRASTSAALGCTTGMGAAM